MNAKIVWLSSLLWEIKIDLTAAKLVGAVCAMTGLESSRTILTACTPCFSYKTIILYGWEVFILEPFTFLIAMNPSFSSTDYSRLIAGACFQNLI